MITLKIDNIYTDIIGDLPSNHVSGIEKCLSFRPDGFQFSPAYNKWIFSKEGVRIRRVWDGWKRQFWAGKKRVYFPTGLMSLVTSYLIEQKIPFSKQDIRIKPEKNIELSLSEKFSFRDYQLKCINDSCNISRGIIHAPTGSGKTAMSAGIINELKVAPFLFFVTSIDLLTQAKESLEDILRLCGNPLEVGQIGGGIVDVKNINVLTVQTAVRCLGGDWNKAYRFDDDDVEDNTYIEDRRKDILDLLRSAKGVICDEVQHWKAETCQLVSKELKSCYYTFGASGTPFRDSGDDMMIQACFGKPCFQISSSQLIRDNWLVKPSIKMVHIRNQKSVFKTWHSIYKDQITDNVEYNEMIAKIANAYINNGRYVLVLTKHIAHGKYLSSMIPNSLYLSGDSPRKERQNGINLLRNKKISCISSSTIFDEGIDIKCLDTVILGGGGKSRVRAMQRIGRVLRPYEEIVDGVVRKKTKATAIDFYIHQKYLKDHAAARAKIYRSEPEFDVEDVEL